MTPLQQIHQSETRTLWFPTPPRHAPSQQIVRIALAGCGVVGGALVRLLNESAAAVSSRYGVRFVITRVLVRDTLRDRHLPIDAGLFTSDLDSFLASDADVVVEAVGGEEPARTIAVTALGRGRKLITANKELISAHGGILHQLAATHHTALDFGAAVGGSAPVVSTLRDLVGSSAPRSVRGILNGTSNFVVSEIERGSTLDKAVAAARGRGLCESDLARDLDGRDAAAKLSIIAWIAFGIKPAELQVRRLSLLPGIEALTSLAGLLGGNLRLLAECTRLDGDRIVGSVEPVLLPANNAFARTSGEENRVEVDLGWTSPLSVSGPGAGGPPTAAAVLSDLVRFTAPPNDRGADARQFVAAADSRRHRWLIAAPIAPIVLSALATAGRVLGGEAQSHDGLSWLITRPATWARANRVLSALRNLGAEPSVARCEIRDDAEAIQ
ncbi:MAG: homoserine dehydrogenase [Gemmatimonadaceae bacterium]